jgi:hypothetical protein
MMGERALVPSARNAEPAEAATPPRLRKRRRLLPHLTGAEVSAYLIVYPMRHAMTVLAPFVLRIGSRAS